MDKKRVMKEIAETSEIIRKKHKALKTAQFDRGTTLNELYRPIVEPLKQLVTNTRGDRDDHDDDDDDTTLSSSEKFNLNEHAVSPLKRKRSMFHHSTPKPTAITDDDDDDDDDGDDSAQTIQTSISRPVPQISVSSHASLEESVRNIVQQSGDDVNQAFDANFGPLSREYMRLFLNDELKKIDNVFGICFNDTNNKLMMGNLTFDLDIDDNLIIGGTRYHGTRGIFELIFKRIPNGDLCTDEDIRKYKEILSRTLVHKRRYSANTQIKSNKGYKYKYVIAPLFAKHGGGGFEKMLVNDKPIEYVHWNDPNELVDRLRLLMASRTAGHTGHNNEINSIIEELREAGLIV